MTEPVHTYRFATVDDAAELVEIYRPYIETSITTEYVCPTVEEFAQRIAERVDIYPYLVVEEDGVPMGYAYASRLFARKGYDWAVELSVYLSVDCRGRGLGRGLYTRLLSLLSMQGVRSAHAKVTEPNEKSDRLHQSLGFRTVGVMDNVSYKVGQWHNITHYEKLIGDFSTEPEPLKLMAELDPEAVAKVLKGLN